MRHRISIMLSLFLIVGVAAASHAGDFTFDFTGSTPVGSWQEREQTTTDAKGKETVTVMRISLVGEEERGGESFVWIEMAMDNYKVKRGKRKSMGEAVAVKYLTKKSVMEGDIANGLGNFNDLAVEVIMQSGDGPPLRIKGAGSMMGNMTQAMGLKATYSMTNEGSDTVTVPAGTFDCTRLTGEGSTSVKVVIKKITVESRSTQWFSEEVPFGLVKIVSDDVVNGKDQHTESVLTAFGTSGATSRITGEPQEMPSLGGMFGG